MTGPIAIYLAKKCNCSCFVRTYNECDDPNFPIGETLEVVQNKYLLDLIETVNKDKYFLVVDLHGCVNGRLSDCSMWSNHFKACSEDILNIFYRNFNRHSLSANCNDGFLGGQVTRQIGQLTNAFQLETIKRIRSLEHANRLQSFLDAMEDSIYQTHEFSKKLGGIKNGYR